MRLVNLVLVTALIGCTCNAFAADPVSNAGNAIGNAASDVGDAVGDAAGAVADVTADTATTTAVKSKLAMESDSFMDVSVTTKDGVVYLSGTVDNLQEANRVAQIAGSVDGVKSVDTSELSYANR